MKILHINSFYPPYGRIGGAEFFVVDLINYLHDQGHQNVVISTSRTRNSSFEYDDYLKVYRVGIKNIYWHGEPQLCNNYQRYIKPLWHMVDSYNPFMSHEIDKIIDKEKPDLINTHMLSGISVSVWRLINKKKIPLVHTIHDHYLMCPRGYMYKEGKICQKQCLACRLLSIPKKIMSNYVNGVSAVSQYILDKHITNGYFSNAKFKEITYSGYDLPTEVKNRGKNKKGTLILGYLGNLFAQKGIELLLDNIPDNMEIFIAGKGDPKYELYLQKKYFTKNVHFLGFVKPVELFSKIDVLVFPSLMMEALGRGIIEAYLYGIPVIASSRGGIPEIVEDGITGRIFNPDDPYELRAILQQITEEPDSWLQMKQNSKKKAASFCKEKTYRLFLNIYEGLL